MVLQEQKMAGYWRGIKRNQEMNDVLKGKI
jgi:hypothetical protein